MNVIILLGTITVFSLSLLGYILISHNVQEVNLQSTLNSTLRENTQLRLEITELQTQNEALGNKIIKLLPLKDTVQELQRQLRYYQADQIPPPPPEPKLELKKDV